MNRHLRLFPPLPFFSTSTISIGVTARPSEMMPRYVTVSLSLLQKEKAPRR